VIDDSGSFVATCIYTGVYVYGITYNFTFLLSLCAIFGELLGCNENFLQVH
jgi:hypothetical protein